MGLVVVTEPGAVFRLRVDDKDGDVSALCQLSSWLHGVARQFPAWSPSVRLAKRWVSSQLLTDQVPEHVLEIIMTHLFLSPGPAGSPPSSPVTAFLRWLQLISSHNWNDSPVLVGQDSPDLSSLMSSSRSSLPAMVLSTPHDPSPSFWTLSSPSWTQLQRLVFLSSQALSSLSSSSPSLSTVFTPSLASYDCLIHLKPLQVPTRHLAVSALLEQDDRRTTDGAKATDVVPVVDYNPVTRYLDQLKTAYGHLALFFYDRYGGTVVAVKFKTFSQDERLRTGELACRQLNGTAVSVNWGAVVEDLQILGEGLVKNIECQNMDHLL